MVSIPLIVAEVEGAEGRRLTERKSVKLARMVVGNGGDAAVGNRKWGVIGANNLCRRRIALWSFRFGNMTI